MFIFKFLYRIFIFDHVDPDRWWFSSDGITRLPRNPDGSIGYRNNP